MTDPRLMESIEHIQHRPSMYIGATDEKGIFELFRETFFYFANEVMAGAFTDLKIILHPDRSLSITGNGKNSKNTPIWPTKQTKSLQELAEAYTGYADKSKYRMGLGFESLPLVNYLSLWFEITVTRDGLEHRFRWERGFYVTPLPAIDLVDDDEVTMHWLPNPDIFGDAQLSATRVEKFLRKTGPLLREATYQLHDELHDKLPISYAFDNGLSHLVEYINEVYTPIGQIIRSLISYADADGNPAEIEFAIQFHREPGVTIMSSANMHFTDGGGSHARGLYAGFQSAMHDAMNWEDDDEDSKARQSWLAGPGYTAAIAMRLCRPGFQWVSRWAIRSTIAHDEIEEKITGIVHKAVIDRLEHDDQLKRYLQ